MTQIPLSYPNLTIFTRKGCVLSHELAKLDPHNFGQLYSNETTEYTHIFKNICNECLLAKFGLRENVLNFTIENFPSCSMYFNRNIKDIYEGPYIQACNVVNDHTNLDVVFPKNTIIFPAGQLIVDTLMSDFETLFNYSSEIPNYELTYNTNKFNFILNPSIYRYFKQLFYTVVCGGSTVQDDNSSLNLVDKVCKQIKGSMKNCLSIVYRNECLKLGNIFLSKAFHSKYVSEGKTIDLNPDKTIKIKSSSYNDVPLADSLTQDKSITRTITLNNTTTFNDIPGVTASQIIRANSTAQQSMLSIRDEMVKNKPYLEKYIINTAPDTMKLEVVNTSEKVHVLSYCIPSQVKYNNETIRQLIYNVSWQDGIGLVAETDICHGDFLVGNMIVELDKLIQHKTNHKSEEIQFEDPGDCDSINVETFHCQPRTRTFTRQNIHKFH